MILSNSSSYLGFNCRLVVNKFLLAVFQKSVGSKYAIRVFFSSDEWWFTSVASVVAFTYFWDCFPWKEDWDQLCAVAATTTNHNHPASWFLCGFFFQINKGIYKFRWNDKLIDKIPKVNFMMSSACVVILDGDNNNQHPSKVDVIMWPLSHRTFQKYQPNYFIICSQQKGIWLLGTGSL